jgi:hypothetical protein
MNAAKLLAWLVLPIVALVLVGMLVIWVFQAILGLLFYFIVGGLVVGCGAYLYRRVRRSIGPGTHGLRRIDAATVTNRKRIR